MGRVNSALATLTMAIKSANDNGGNTVASNVGRKCCHYSATLIESNTRSDNSNTNNNKGDERHSNSCSVLDCEIPITYRILYRISLFVMQS